MRSMMIAALSAALLFGCNDDEDELSDGGSSGDASVDGGKLDGSIDGGIDASTDGGRDASLDGSSDGGVSAATASLASKSSSTVTGSASATRVGGVVTLVVTVSGATPGEHGIHIHQTGDCSAPDAASAGAHWNPDAHDHGSGAADAGASSHLGDLGNILIGEDGKGTLTVAKPEWTLGDGAATDVLGHALVVHAAVDDLATQPSGNSGGRQACGVITPS